MLKIWWYICECIRNRCGRSQVVGRVMSDAVGCIDFFYFMHNKCDCDFIILFDTEDPGESKTSVLGTILFNIFGRKDFPVSKGRQRKIESFFQMTKSEFELIKYLAAFSRATKIKIEFLSAIFDYSSAKVINYTKVSSWTGFMIWVVVCNVICGCFRLFHTHAPKNNGKMMYWVHFAGLNGNSNIGESVSFHILGEKFTRSHRTLNILIWVYVWVIK